MNFLLKPSLEHMALVKIGISLWNQKDVSALISKLSDLNPFVWKEIEERVLDKVPQLSLPELLKEKVFGVIKPIGIQILEWMQYYRKYDLIMEFHCLNLDLPAHLPTELCWTSQGTVDRKTTAEMLVKDDNLNVSRRYRLACDYFLEDDIIRFWNRLPEYLKDYDWRPFPVISFWSNNMKRGVADYISYKDLFYSSVGDSNKVAAEYFLQKLTPQEREESLKDLAEQTEDADVIFLLLSEIEKEEQVKFLKNNPFRVLHCFLQWPWQSFFIGVANRMWDFLPRDYYGIILGDIGKVRDGYKDYNYQKLFREFKQRSPSALKSFLIEEIYERLLLSLFHIKDKENIRFILKDATPTEKTKLIYSQKFYYYLLISCHIFHEDEWDFLQFFIRECFLSKNEMLKFKEDIEKRKHFQEDCSATEKHKWHQLFHFSDNSFCKHNKHSLEEGESSSSKRFQNLQ